MDESRISACTYPLREQAVEYALEVIADSGIKKVDLLGRMPHFSEDPSEFSLDKLQYTAQSMGLQIANLGSYPGAAFSDDSEATRQAELEKMRATIDAAAELGCRSIRVMPGHGEDPAIIEQVAPLMAESAAYAQQRGILLGMENHGGSIAGNPAHAKQLCAAVDSAYFGVLYEPCNLLHGQVDYKQAFEVLADYIVHIHIKDGRWRDGEFRRTHLGEGDVDIEWVVAAMESIGYTGDYALEYELPEDPVESSLARWYEYFKSVTP